MSNLQNARSRIFEVIADATSQRDHFAKIVMTLEKTLTELDSMLAVESGGRASSNKTHGETREHKPGRPAGSTKGAIKEVGKGTTDAKAENVAKPAKTEKPAKSAKLPKAGKQRAKVEASKLPPTRGTFWTDLLSKEPMSKVDVLNSAFIKLAVEPNPQRKAQLENRATGALNALVKAQQIKDTGSGRERRFFIG